MDKKQITLRIPDEIHEALKKESERMGISVTELVMYAIDCLLDKLSNTDG